MSESENLHPVVELAKRVIRKDDSGEFRLSVEGASALERIIVAHKSDEGIVGALQVLFGLVVIFTEDEPKSEEAAAMLVAVLGRVQPHLVHLAAQGAAMAGDRRDRLRTIAATVFGDGDSAVKKLSGDRPEGAISVRTLEMPPMPRPGLRRRK